MLFEMVSEFQSELYPMYVYVSFLIMFVCAYNLFHLSYSHVQKHRFVSYKQKHDLKNRIQQTSIHVNTPLKATRLWIIKKMNVKDSPDDVAENPFLFFYHLLFKTQGGFPCLNALYSQT